MPRSVCPLVLAALAPLALTTVAAAQSELGVLLNTGVSFTSRGSNSSPNTNPSVAFVRLDSDRYAGWGVDASSPGMRTVTGITGTIQDQIGNTPETYDLLVYTEDPANLDYPLVTAPQGMAGPFPTPASTATGAIAFGYSMNFATPMTTPANADVFLGIGLPQPTGTTWPNDGLSCHAMYYVFQPPATSYDLAGPAQPSGPPGEGQSGYYVPSSTLGPTYTTTSRQWMIEAIVPGAAGVACTVTNQTSAVASNAPPGMAGGGSGLYPDAANPPLNPGRMDDIVSRWFMAGMPDNSAVFFFASFQPIAPDIPLSLFVPGEGAVCIDTTSFSQIALGFTSGGEATFAWNFSPTARTLIGGLSIVHQSIGIDPATSMAYANGCTRQSF